MGYVNVCTQTQIGQFWVRIPLVREIAVTFGFFPLLEMGQQLFLHLGWVPQLWRVMSANVHWFWLLGET
jgi:hypothetical protein